MTTRDPKLNAVHQRNWRREHKKRVEALRARILELETQIAAALAALAEANEGAACDQVLEVLDAMPGLREEVRQRLTAAGV